MTRNVLLPWFGLPEKSMRSIWIVSSKRCDWFTIETGVNDTYNIYIITPNDHMSHDLSYFSGPRTSGAENKQTPLDSLLPFIAFTLQVILM